jgi:NADH:ubiquinone oxidoreductase subunit H
MLVEIKFSKNMILTSIFLICEKANNSRFYFDIYEIKQKIHKKYKIHEKNMSE